MKKIYSAFFIFLGILLSFTCLLSYQSKQIRAEEYFVSEIKNKQTKNIEEIESKSAILIEKNSNKILFEKNKTEKMPIASMCKIMTLLLTFEALDNGKIDMEKELTISENASGMGGSQVFLEPNEKYKVKDLIKSVVVASANDASVALAEEIAGSEENFVKLMNEKAQNLGMDNTNFVNCTGLPKDGQYSCALDVAIMFSNLLNHRQYFDFSRIWMDKIEHSDGKYTEISNTNKLIRFYEGCDSGKTGYTSFAGHCLASSAMKGNMRLISVIICAPDSKTRFNESKQLFNYGFNNYENKMVIDDHKPLDTQLYVSGGKNEVAQVTTSRPVFVLIKKGEKINYDIDIEFDKIKLPVLKGEKVGKLTLFENGIEILSTDVVAFQDILKANYFDYIGKITKNWNII